MRWAQVNGQGSSAQIVGFANDEKGLLLGVNGATPLASAPSNGTNSHHASNASGGDPTLKDPSNRPFYPALYISDITGNPNATSGQYDFQAGGSPVNVNAMGQPFINDVFGTWATATVSNGTYTATPPTAKNDWTLGTGSDQPVGTTFAAMGDEGFGAEVRWNASDLTDGAGSALQPGHTYRVQVLTHDGDQNKAGGDAGEFCVILTLPKLPSPTIVTHATSGNVGDTITDSATVSGGAGNPTPTGSVTFKAYSDSSCTTQVYTDTEPLSGGTATAAGFKPTGTGTYYWVDTYSGDGHYAAAGPYPGAAGSTACSSDPLEQSVVSPKQPTISTTATTPVTLGASIKDTATVSGGSSPTGTVTFKLYDNSSCTAPAVFTDTETLSGGSATSASFTPAAAGDYFWIASYSGDNNNKSVSGSCGDQGEKSTVNQKQPTISTTATTPVTLGASITDTATVSGGSSPTGTVTFKLYNNSSCTAPAVFTDTETLSGGSATSASFTPAAAGDYFWIASYSGDNNNKSVSGSCGDQGEKSTVNPKQPTISTTATTPVTLGGSIKDTATVSGGSSPTGTVTFKLYNNSSCTAPAVFTDTETLSGGSATSASFTPTSAGDYFWIASYSGDANNKSVSGSCGDQGEKSTVNQKQPSISTVATSGSIGQPIQDTATVSGGTNPTGTVTFKLYSNSFCTAPAVFTDTEALDNNGQATSASFTPTAAGNYFWIASYSGDNNNKSVSGSCGDQGETSTVDKKTPTLTTSAISGTAGSPIHDTATLTGGFNPTGTITWNVYNHDTDAGCTTPLNQSAFSVTVTAGKTSYNSPDFTPASAGHYEWVATYSGDANNVPLTTSCTDPAELSTVTNNPTPAITLVKSERIGQDAFTHGPISGDIGQTVDYHIDVTNTGNTDLVIAFTDSHCDSGTLSGPTVLSGSYNASTKTLGSGGELEYTCSHVLAAGDQPYTNTGNVTGTVPGTNTTVSAHDSVDASANPPANPAITLVKSEKIGINAFSHGPINGNVADTVNYHMDVSNTGNTDLVIAFTDAQCDNGTLSGPSVLAGTYNAGTKTLSSGGELEYTCSHVLGANDRPYTNTANVVGTVPGTNRTVSAQDSVQASVPTPGPAITLVKQERIGDSSFTHGPITGDVGSTVDYEMTVSNTGNTDLVISFTDPRCDSGTLSGPSVVSGNYNPATQTLSAGGVLQYTCSHVLAQGDEPYTNTGFVTGTPPPGQGSPVSAQDSVQASANVPGMRVVKLQRDGTSGPFTSGDITASVGDTIYYEIRTTNTGNVPLTLSLSDPHCDSGTIQGPFKVSGTLNGDVLSPGGVAQYTCWHVVSAADLPAYTNVGTITGTPPSGPPVHGHGIVVAHITRAAIEAVKLAAAPCSAVSTTESQPSGILPCNGNYSQFTTGVITLKVPSGNYSIPIEYQIRVTNTGNAPLALSLDDPLCNPGSIQGPTQVSGTLNGTTLSPGGQALYTCTRNVTQNDGNTGAVGQPFTNTATVTGTPPSGPPVHTTTIVTVHRVPPPGAVCVALRGPHKGHQIHYTGKKPAVCKPHKPPSKRPKHPSGFTG
jgi:hypothetical protein